VSGPDGVRCHSRNDHHRPLSRGEIWQRDVFSWQVLLSLCGWVILCITRVFNPTAITCRRIGQQLLLIRKGWVKFGKTPSANKCKRSPAPSLGLALRELARVRHNSWHER